MARLLHTSSMMVQRAGGGPARQSQRGFTLLELLIVIALIGIIAGIGTALVQSWLPLARADAALRQMGTALTVAREQAIGQRRLMEIQIDNNELRVVRHETGDGTTLMRTMPLEQDVHLMLFSDVPDTPDQFGQATAVDFGAALQLQFNSDGSFIDEQGVPVNGSVFMGIPGNSRTARAVTVLGGTGRIRVYRWTGNTWNR